MPLPREDLLLVTGRSRGAGRLDAPVLAPVPDPAVDQVLAALAGADAAGGPAAVVWLGGGEPTLRADLPELVRAVRAALPSRVALGLGTDGLALGAPEVASALRSWGVDRVRIPLHAARGDAHDWLTDTPGAARRVARAVRACVAAGLRVEVEVVVTRPTVDMLPETVAAAARLGAQGVHLRRVQARGPAGAAFVSLSPRLGLAEPLLERAVRGAEAQGCVAWLHGFPRCAAPAVAHAQAGPPARLLVPAGGLHALATALAPLSAAPGCPACPADATCPGAPADYVAHLGRTEIDDRCSHPPRQGLALPSGEGPAATLPPPRAGRAPATRLLFAQRQAERGPLHGDPMDGVPGIELPSEVRISFSADRSSRSLRQELCVLAQVGAATLRIADDHSLRHPQAPALLQECVRLSFARVEVEGPVEALAGMDDRSLIGLQGLSRVVALLHGDDAAAHDAVAGPGAWQAAHDTLARLARLAHAEVGTRRADPPGDPGPGAASEAPLRLPAALG